MVHVRVTGSYIFVPNLPRPASKYALRPTITKQASCLSMIGASGLTSIHFAGASIVGEIDGLSDGKCEGDAFGSMEGCSEGVELGIVIGVSVGDFEGAGVVVVLTMLKVTCRCCPLTPVALARLYGVAATVYVPTTN